MHHGIPVGKYLLLALMSSWILEAMMMTGVQGNLATAGSEARVGRVLKPVLLTRLVIVPSHNIFPFELRKYANHYCYLIDSNQSF